MNCHQTGHWRDLFDESVNEVVAFFVATGQASPATVALIQFCQLNKSYA